MTPEEKAELKPCPFCEGQAYIMDDCRISVQQIYIGCLKCHAQGPAVPITKDKIENRKVAIRLWNERVSNMHKEGKKHEQV